MRPTLGHRSSSEIRLTAVCPDRLRSCQEEYVTRREKPVVRDQDMVDIVLPTQTGRDYRDARPTTWADLLAERCRCGWQDYSVTCR